MVTRWTPSIERQENFKSMDKYLISIPKLTEDDTKFTY